MGVAGALYLVLTASFFAACAYAQVRRRRRVKMEKNTGKIASLLVNRQPQSHSIPGPALHPPHNPSLNLPDDSPPCIHASRAPSQLNDPDPELWMFLYD